MPLRTDAPHPASFRDPSGAVYYHQGTLYRRVNPVYREHYDALVGSGLLEALWADGLLIDHRVVEVDHPQARGAYRVLQPDPVPFISYPYEWCFAQFKAAALTTLAVHKAALERGMVLKDASAYNVQFIGARPVLIDTLSFETYREGEPWAAYRQFCQHFLAPLALMAYRGVELGRLSRLYIDGVPLDLAARLLPARSWLRVGLAMHLHLHARAQRGAARTAGAARRAEGRSMSRTAMLGLVDSLESAVRGLTWRPTDTPWGEYADTADHYTEADVAAKRAAVVRFLERVGPRTVWDLGANTGAYSRLAAERGAYTVCLDGDPGAVERCYAEAVRRGEENVLPLLMDLANPSPDLGWAQEEREGLAARGPADLVMALALVHHLAIGNNVPWGRMADYFARLGGWLIVEWVPKDDPRVQGLLAHRRDVFDAYDRGSFEVAFGERYEILERAELPTLARALYLMRRKGGER